DQPQWPAPADRDARTAQRRPARLRGNGGNEPTGHVAVRPHDRSRGWRELDDAVHPRVLSALSGTCARTSTRTTIFQRAAAHARMMRAISVTPSVRAAGPGWRITGDLISCSSPSRTAGMASHPGRATTFSGRNFLPHHEPRMM